ncbi:integrase core domain-containing protein [Streptomyces sp. AC495_CC817]|uniref:integrase core domain-containing protein n=1 Tax=Streptomyces sp. AC495_CC817 TaxID=2823900 RepID=UPI001C25D4E9|nr:integrase core domain-containing protein [Streptomyces sp. AC495_CC817]
MARRTVERLGTVFVLDALEMAIWQRDRDQQSVQPGKLIHHSDAGSQYTSFKLAEHLDAAGIAAGIGSVGDAYDNALTESTIGLFKTELVKPRRPWKTLSQVELATAEWVDWYNHRRLHGERGHVPPVKYEADYYTELKKPQITTTVRDLYGTRVGSVRSRSLGAGPWDGWCVIAPVDACHSLRVRRAWAVPGR